MAGVLDSARFRAFIAMELNVSVENTPMPSFWEGTATPWCAGRRYSSVAGIPITELLTPERIGPWYSARATGGGRNRQPAENRQRLLRSGFRRRGNGGVHSQDKKESPALRRLSRRRIRHPRSLHRRPGQLGAQGVEQVHGNKLSAAENAALQKIGRRGTGIKNRAEQTDLLTVDGTLSAFLSAGEEPSADLPERFLLFRPAADSTGQRAQFPRASLPVWSRRFRSVS